MKKNGFTLIELMIVVAIIGILSVAVIPSGQDRKKETNISYGINGLTEVRCIEGYKFIIGQSGSAQQVMNDKGHGVSCDSSPMGMGK